LGIHNHLILTAAETGESRHAQWRPHKWNAP
jgi:hypothetical protein